MLFKYNTLTELRPLKQKFVDSNTTFEDNLKEYD